jgi:hypothetical protein
MMNLLLNQPLFAPDATGLAGPYAFQHRSGKMLASLTWGSVKCFMLLVMIAASLLPASAHAWTNKTVNANVPFEFHVGDRTFLPGTYQLTVTGPRQMTLSNAHSGIIAAFDTRSKETNGPLPVSKLIFYKQGNHSELAQIWIERRGEVVMVVGEQFKKTHATRTASCDSADRD